MIIISPIELYIKRLMMRSLSTRSQLSELADEDCSSSSTSSCSRVTCRCISQAKCPAAAANGSFYKRDSLDSDEPDSGGGNGGGGSTKEHANKWNFMPATVWKQTAEVKKQA